MGRIDSELDTIKTHRYGEEVRMAIHDALDKLEKTSGGSMNKPTIAMLVADSAGDAIIGDARKEEE